VISRITDEFFQQSSKLGFDVDIQLDEGIVALSLGLTPADKPE
jgi:hypothetical protein